jgi:uncharacterized protein (TIGR03000 family)
MLRPLTAAAGGLLCVLASLAHPLLAGGPAGKGDRSIVIEVRLPADARVEFNGNPTKATGAVRRFETPPLAPGKTFTYLLKVTWRGKVVERKVAVKVDELAVVELRPEHFQDGGAGPVRKDLPKRDGFVTVEHEGRWWIFRADSKELARFKKEGPPEVHVSRINVPPYRRTLKAPDLATMEEYLTAKPGFVTKYRDGRLWVFRADSKELESFLKDGDLAKQVVRPGAGPRGLTLKGPDRETIDAYLKAPAE